MSRIVMLVYSITFLVQLLRGNARLRTQLMVLGIIVLHKLWCRLTCRTMATSAACRWRWVAPCNPQGSRPCYASIRIGHVFKVRDQLPRVFNLARLDSLLLFSTNVHVSHPYYSMTESTSMPLMGKPMMFLHSLLNLAITVVAVANDADFCCASAIFRRGCSR